MIAQFPGGYWETVEGGILINVRYTKSRWEQFKELFFTEPELLNPPHRILTVARQGKFWNFAKEEFGEWVEGDSQKFIHVSEEANYKNYFYIFDRAEKENSRDE